MDIVLFFIRTLFVIVTASIGYQIVELVLPNNPPFHLYNILGILGGAFLSIFAILLEIKYALKFISGIFAVIFGLLIGFLASTLFLQGLFIIPQVKRGISGIPERMYIELKEILRVGVTFFFCYLGVVIILKTRDSFKLLIPFVELSKTGDKVKPFIIDTSIVIDGRISEIYDTNIMKGPIIIPRFILEEVQNIADSPDKSKRNRGRRGLDMLAALRKKESIEIRIEDERFSHLKEVDSKLIALAKKINGRIVTNDYNLKKIAQLQGIETINLNELANALRPSVLPGEILEVRLVKEGEEADQGVGYMEDGTVVVVENAKRYVGKLISVSVTNVLQTNVGRMIFGRLNRS